MGHSVINDIEGYRNDPTETCWNLPRWGHPLSQGVMPLFMSYGERLFPVGTAFTVGKGIVFVVSAAHTIDEGFKYEERLGHVLFGNGDRPKAVDFREVGFYVLHQRPIGKDGLRLTLWPLETVDGAPPTDVVFGFPKFDGELGVINHRLSFDIPKRGQTVWGIGYTDEPGVSYPMSDILNGSFDWLRDCSLEFVVAKGRVTRVFTRRFARGGIGGPCFAFGAETRGAQSGGPVITSDGLVVGVVSAGATEFFNEPASLASLLFPLLTTNLRFGATHGVGRPRITVGDQRIELPPQQLRLNASRPLLGLITQGVIKTDGSEERVGFTEVPGTSSLMVNPVAPTEMVPYVHDDFASFQEGKTSTKATGPIRRFRRNEDPVIETQALNASAREAHHGRGRAALRGSVRSMRGFVRPVLRRLVALATKFVPGT